MKKSCIVCGGAFSAPPSSKKITCSPECSKKKKIQSHTGKSNKWKEESKKKLSQAGMTKNLLLGMPAAQKSPIAGPFETNQNALVWTLKDPHGHIHTARNLSLFLRNHESELDGTIEQARAGIMQIRRARQGKTKRAVTQWKGWRLLNVTKPKGE